MELFKRVYLSLIWNMFLFVTFFQPCFLDHIEARPSLFVLEEASINSDSKSVYFRHLNDVFKRSPEIVISALVSQERRKAHERNHFLSLPAVNFPYRNPSNGYEQPMNNFNVPHRVTWVWTPQGSYPLIETMNRPPPSKRCKTTSIQEANKPMLSFYEPPKDPCADDTGNHSYFAVTASSGMSDILCMLCQYLNSLQCIWQFCSHPEGVYKYKTPSK